MTALTTSPTIRVTDVSPRGRTLTCPAGHTYTHGGKGDAVMLAEWVVAHEIHQEDQR